MSFEAGIQQVMHKSRASMGVPAQSISLGKVLRATREASGNQAEQQNAKIEARALAKMDKDVFDSLDFPIELDGGDASDDASQGPDGMEVPPDGSDGTDLTDISFAADIAFADSDYDPLLTAQSRLRSASESDLKNRKTVVWWYLQELSKHKLLSSQEEIELGRRIQAGSEKALLELVAGNLRLVVSIAKRYMRQGMDFEDVIQEGNMGLMLAARKFDPSMGYKFSTYATWWIRQAITRALSNKSRTIRLPVHVNEMLFKLRRAAKPFYQKMGRPPTVAELCQATGYSESDVEHVLKSSMSTLSMDEYIAAGEDDTLEKFIEDKFRPKPEDHAESELLTRKVRGLMTNLASDERSVLIPLYGLDGKCRRSAKEVAALLNIEVRDVRRIEIRGLRRLRRATHNRKLNDYLADA